MRAERLTRHQAHGPCALGATAMRHTAQAFTLVELLLVIAIISLLTSLLLPMGGRIYEAANRARCAAQLKGLASAYMAYTNTIGRFPPVWHRSEYKGYDVHGPKYAGWFPTTHTYCVFVEYRRFDVGFGPLLFHGYASDPESFVCPVLAASGEPWWHTEPTTDPLYMNFHETNPNPVDLLEEWWRRPGHRLETYGSYASYSLRPGLYPYTLPAIMERGFSALAADNFHYPDVVLRRHVSGVNVAYLDGSVMFREPHILIDNAYLTGGYYPLGDGNRLEDTEYCRIWQALEERD